MSYTFCTGTGEASCCCCWAIMFGFDDVAIKWGSNISAEVFEGELDDAAMPEINRTSFVLAVNEWFVFLTLKT